MIKFIENKKNEKLIIICFIFICIALAFFVAVIQPINTGPDEQMKMDICKYVAEKGKLPHGGDKEVLDPSWGISYGFTPITPYIISGLFIKIVSNYTQDMHTFYVASRLVSVICYGIFIGFNIKIAKELFKEKYASILFVALTSLLPQMIYLGSYLNNDCFAMMTISMIIYYGIKGYQNDWKYKNCILYGIAIGLCALSYYNAYGYILTSVILFIGSQIMRKNKITEILKKGLVVSCVVLLVSGWWFIRSAIIYDGDFLGLKTTDEYSNKYALEQYKADNRMTPHKENIPLTTMLINDGWINLTLRSFIGIFGGMDVPIPRSVCFIALMVIFVGLVCYLISVFMHKKKELQGGDSRDVLLIGVFIVDIIIPIALSLYYSYYSDFQPQGRYIMPILIPLMYFVTKGWDFTIDKLEKKPKLQKMFKTALAITLCFVLVMSIKTLITAYI